METKVFVSSCSRLPSLSTRACTSFPKFVFAIGPNECDYRRENAKNVCKQRKKRLYSYSMDSTCYELATLTDGGSGKDILDSSIKRQISAGFNSKAKGSRNSRFMLFASTRAGDVAEPDGRKAKLIAQRLEEFELEEMERPLSEYMSLPASQYSVLDAERIERVDENSFKCYAHRIKFFMFEVCPVLLVRVEEQPNGCCIRLLSCTLEGSPIVEAQNDKFSASMENNVVWKVSTNSSISRLLVSDTTIQVDLLIPPAFTFLSVEAIEATGSQVLSQVLRLMLPRFLQQLGKDYRAWASGDESRQALGTGEL